MDEEARFEARAVFAPRRARMARLALLLPVLALVAVAWVGIAGTPSDEATPEIANATSLAVPSATVEGTTVVVAPGVPRPTEVVGLEVQRLEDVQPQALGRDDVVAVTGWYVATAITDCPPLAALYRKGALPDVRGDADEWAFCERAGVLYASPPDPDKPSATNSLAFDRTGDEAPSAVAVTLVVGVVVPQALEIIGADATEVVVLGRFVPSGDRCPVLPGCRRDLVVDHLAWTSGA